LLKLRSGQFLHLLAHFAHTTLHQLV
jgi:hypothetical protein